jgi:hypothetical protein
MDLGRAGPAALGLLVAVVVPLEVWAVAQG